MRTERSRLWLAVLAVALVGALMVVAGCGDSDSESSGGSGDGDGPTVGVVLPDTTAFPAYAAEQRGMEAAARRLGVKLEFATTTGDFTPQKYQDAIDAMIARGIKQFAFDPYDPRLFAPVIRRLQSEGVQVVNVGNAREANEASVVNTDTEGAITAAMDQFVEAMGGPGKVGMLVVPASSVVMERVAAAKKALDVLGADVVAELPAGQTCDQVRGANATEDMLQAHPEIRGIFVPCGPPGVGAANAVEQAGKDVVVYSFDGSDDELRAVGAGQLAGTIRQRFDEIGAKTIEVLRDLANGREVATSYVTGFDVITRDNVDQFAGR